MKQIRAGIIGLGVGEAHIAGYSGHSRCEVLMVCDTNPEIEAVKEHSIGGIPFTSDPRDILCNPDIDIVSICSYDNFHFEQIVLAIDNDKHIFVEKPLCLFENEAEIIFKKLANKPHLKVSSNLILRQSERFKDLKIRIENDELGKLFHVNGAYNYGRLQKLTAGWRGDIPFYSVTYGGGVHIIDLITWLFDQRVSSVFSMGNNLCTSGSKFKFNDVVSSVMKFENGATAQITSNFSCVHPHFHQLDIYGKSGTFINGFDEAILYKTRDSREQTTLSTSYPGIHKGDLLNDFVDSILLNNEPLVAKKDVFDVMSICFAVEKSMNSGKEEKVNYLD
jgi:predicted dehydrogenase